MSIHDSEEVVIDEGPNLNQRITGYIGSFNTNDSYNVNYLLSSLNIKEFKLLDIASEVFKFDQVDFEEMVQRDVDPVRVQEEIIDQYLKAGKNRALFFPPLIVSVIAFDNLDKPVHQFNEIHEENNGKTFIKRWDNFFAIEARIADKGSNAYIKGKAGSLIPIHPYASKILYDDKQVKLVVIDGQHRFYALRELSGRQPDLIKDIDLPICIVFSPDAIARNGGQDVMNNLRNMFVTINNKAKDVSGHFLDLLNDHSIASLCVRELANAWKESDPDSLRSNLQFMEWNQRNKSKSNQVNNQHSITTVSIIADALRNYVFNNKKDSKTFNLLALGTRKDELEKHPNSTSIYYITESEFDVEQAYILRELAKEYVVPCLDWLLLKPTVYRHIQDKYLKAIDVLEANVEKGKDGWLTFKKLIKDFKESNKLSPEAAILAERDFNKEIILDKGIDTYRKNVFQQGYIRVWAQVSDYLITEYEISPFITAKAMVAAYEKLVFDYRRNIFDKDQAYANLILYDKTGKPNVTSRGKQAWSEILMSFYIENKTSNEFIKALKSELGEAFDPDKSKNVVDKLTAWSQKALASYSSEFLEKIEKDYNNNWRIKEFPKAFKDKLEGLISKEDPDSFDEFQKLIKEKADYAYKQSIEPLYSLLGVDKKSIPSTIFDSQDTDQI
ncbi:ParB N-terminal domain-containing protein [Geobacter argillaceus]|uniref:DGQHR domain-containing protein n=1 Tax=Geobacter argillaceus TaxID=345631 RepID=A0A562W999_9BACT|nr:DNA sulfur modification protein DndB [Geobacter argillaceus]TWJ26537.1 DGQHR domain-containing protein [Geobacter argillaceus]